MLIGFALVVFWGGEAQDGLAAPQEEQGSKPAWTTVGTHPSYLPPRYIQGVGLAKASKNSAKDRQTADQNSFSEIIRQISAEVSTEFSVEKMEVTGDKGETILERTSAGAKIRSSMTLSGLTIVERYYDPQEKIYYSLGILDRISASEPYLQTLENYRQDYERYSKSAMEYRQQGKVFQSLLSLREAYHAAYRYQEKLPSYQLLAGHLGEIDLETSPPPASAAVLEKLTEILSHLEFQITKGDRQSFIFDKPLSTPLVVRLILNDGSPIPAEGFPVTFSFHAGQGKLIPQTGRTDNQGLTTAVVSGMERSNDSEYAVTAALDLHELLDYIDDGGAWDSRIPVDSKEALFTFAPKKAPEGARVLILISGQNNGEARSSLMRNVLTTHFSQAGFSPVSESELGDIHAERIQETLRHLSMENLRKQLPRNVEVLILAEIAGSSSSRAMGMMVCSIDGVVKAISVKDGLMIASESFQNARGFGLTEAQAKNEAYKNAGLEIADSLIGDLLARYEAP